MTLGRSTCEEMNGEENEERHVEDESADHSSSKSCFVNDDTHSCNGDAHDCLIEKKDFPLTCSQGDEEEEKEGEEEDDDLPIDRGWAWVVLAGSVLNIAIMVGYIRALSLLFIEYLQVFNASAAKTTLLMGVNAAVYSVSALLTMHILVGRFGVRKTTFMGATLSVIGMACAISPINIDFIIGTHSTILGVGHAMIFGPSVVQAGMYFKKRRGLASAVTMSGVSLGGMIFPPTTRYFLDEYGLQGTMILLTGVTLNLYVGASVFCPLESFKKKKKKGTKKGCQSNKECASKSYDKVNECPSILITSHTSLNSNLKPDTDSHSQSPFISRHLLRSESTGSNVSRPNKHLLLYASQPDFGSLLSIPGTNRVDIAEIQPDKERQMRTPCECLKNVFSTLDFSLFKRPMFLLVICYSFFCVTSSLVGAYLPALSAEKGISKQDAALFLTILGALDFAGRLILGFLLDTGIIRVNVLMGLGLIVNGTCSFFTYFYNSYSTLLVFACINGISTCTYFGVIPVAIIEFMGIDYLAKTLGFVSLFHGISVAIANPVIGGIRDTTGSYVEAYHYLGASTSMGALLLLCEPLVRRYANRNNTTTLDVHVDANRNNTTTLDVHVDSKPQNGGMNSV